MENYKFVKQIGEGSYGKVQLVRAPDGKNCVIKVVDTRRMNAKEKKAAMNEVKVLSSLKHPYVVRYYDSFLNAGKLCIVMQFAEKGDLYSRIKQARNGRRIPQEQVLEWFTQGVLALKYLHDLKILHRDLKSQNMFLTAEERLKVGDFGISRVLSGTMAFARTMIGTPYYMSPEVCSERPYSWASDIWAMGCVMFELYQLKVPFEASSIRELMQKIVRGAIPRATKAPGPVQQLCAEMMAREATKRPSAAQILERPLIQDQIRSMLKQSHANESGKVPVGIGQPAPLQESPAQQQGVLQQPVHPARAASPGAAYRAASPSPNLPPPARAPSPNLRRLVSDNVVPRPHMPPSPRLAGPHMPPSPRVGAPGLPPKAVQREPSAPVLLNGLARVPNSPRIAPRLDPFPPSPKWHAGSPRRYVPASPARGRSESPARAWSPRAHEANGVYDPSDWYQRAMGLLR